MSSSTRLLLLSSLAIAVLSLGFGDLPVSAQPKAPLIAPAPQLPTIGQPNPIAVQRGKSVDMSIAGTNLDDAVGVWSSGPLKISINDDKKNSATRVRLKVDVSAEAPIGLYPIRVVSRSGISNVRLLAVDELPTTIKVTGNQKRETAQAITLPALVVGRVDVETSDFYKISVKPGQRLTFEILSRRLGSPFDPIVLLHDAKTNREIPGLYSDDAPGLQGDARLTHTFKEGGDFLVEVRDSTHRGGPDHHYCLRMGDFPAAVAALPIAIKRGAKVPVTFTGAAVEGVANVDVAAPSDPNQTVLYVSPKYASGPGGWPVPIQLRDMDEIAETEPNNEIAKANKLPIPCGVTGRFQAKGDVDFFSFPAKKGTKYIVQAETYEIGSPAEVYLTLKNAKNAELAKSVPTAANARVEFTATEDGDLFIHAEHLNFAHGPNEFYHLTVRPAEPDFEITLAIDRFDVAKGGTTLIPITGIVRRDHAGPIELSIVGHPGFSGNVTIPAGIPPATPAPGTIIAHLPLTATGDVPPGGYELRIRAKASVAGKDIVRFATVTDAVKVGLAALPFPPREVQTSIAVSVNGGSLFVIGAVKPSTDVVRGVATNIPFTVQRSKDSTDVITLTAVGLPANVTATASPIPNPATKGEPKFEVSVTAAAAATPGPATIYLRAATKAFGKDFIVYTNPITINIVPEKKDEKKDVKKDEKKDVKKDVKKDGK